VNRFRRLLHSHLVGRGCDGVHSQAGILSCEGVHSLQRRRFERLGCERVHSSVCGLAPARHQSNCGSGPFGLWDRLQPGPGQPGHFVQSSLARTTIRPISGPSRTHPHAARLLAGPASAKVSRRGTVPAAPATRRIVSRCASGLMRTCRVRGASGRDSCLASPAPSLS